MPVLTAGSARALLSYSPWPNPSVQPPVNSVAPSISSPNAIEGSLATVTQGTYTGGVPDTITEQWTRAGADISGETGLNYLFKAADVGALIRAKETATNTAGSAVTSSNGITVLNGIVGRVFPRATAASATDPARGTYWVNADGSTTINRVPQGGIGSYSFKGVGGIGSAQDSNVGGGLSGYVTMNDNSKGMAILGAIPGSTVKVRLALGRQAIAETTAIGFSIWDGDPAAGGVQRMEGAFTVANGNVADQTGAQMSPANWASVAAYSDILCNSGSIYVQRKVSATAATGYFRAFEVVYPSFVVETAGVGPYFVKVGGDNTKDGKSLANAWANLPGDPNAVGGQVANFVLLPGAVVNVEGGQIHKPAAFGARTAFMFQKAAGANGSPITIQPRSGSGEPIFEGSEDLPFVTAASSGDVFANPNLASITYETVTAVEWNAAPVCAGYMLRPATFPKASDISAYEDTDSGSDAYWPENTVTGPGGSAPLFVEGAADSERAGYKRCTYSGGRVLTRYGSVSVNGYPIMIRFAGNQVDLAMITSHNTATGGFTFEIPNGRSLFAATSGNDFLWQIRYHPWDILEQNQYALNTTRTKVFGWFPGSGTRGICRLTRGVTAQYSDWTWTGIQWRNFAGGAQVSILTDGLSPNLYHPDRIKFSGKIRNTGDYNRDYLIYAGGYGTGWDLSDIDIADSFTKGGIAFALLHDSVANRLKFRETGRTDLYAGGSPSNSKDITVTDIDTCDGSAIHGNGGSQYSDAIRIKYWQWLGLNHIRPSTNQGATVGLSRANEISYAALTGRLQPAGAPHPSSLIVLTNDGNGKDCIWDHLWVGEGVGVHLGYDSAGMVVKNCYFSQLGASAGALTGVIFQNVVISTANGGITSLSDLINIYGADPSSYNVTFTAAPFDGSISDLARQAITRSNGATLPATYAAVNIGTTVAGRQWNIPASGTTFALADFGLTTQAVRKGHRALLPFCQAFNHSPESVLDLPTGVGGSNNSLFGILRGKVYFLANAAVGTYNLDIRQTNASADRTGPSTRTTRFVITVA